MNLSKDIQLIDLCVYLVTDKVLILSDLHLGYEEQLNNRGILIPRHQYKDTLARLKHILKQVCPKIIVLNGDLKHSFGEILDTEWRHIGKIVSYLKQHCDDLIFVKGNHDIKLNPLARKHSVKIVETYRKRSYLICHGNVIPKAAKDATICTIIIGDAHPAVTLQNYPRRENYKCYLHGNWHDKQLIVQPSFNQVVEGTDVLTEQPKSPFLKRLNNFQVIVIGDKLYDFGTISTLR